MKGSGREFVFILFVVIGIAFGGVLIGTYFGANLMLSK